jgi:hypothetical protein
MVWIARGGSVASRMVGFMPGTTGEMVVIGMVAEEVRVVLAEAALAKAEAAAMAVAATRVEAVVAANVELGPVARI